MKFIDTDFSDVEVFDVNTADKLKDYFDLLYTTKDKSEYRLWFDNLRILANQNLGLAHCVIHNQTARNTIELAYARTQLEIFNRPYGSNVGAFSFSKGFSKFNPDTILLKDGKLTGTKLWASQLNTANYMVLRVRTDSTTRQVHSVFLDLNQVENKVTVSNCKPLGMDVAHPCDLYIDTVLPQEWLLSHPNSNDEYRQLSNFHFYGLTGNYLSVANSLLSQAESQGYNVSYDINKLRLALNISEDLWRKSFDEIFTEQDIGQGEKLNTQYQFARKNLIDTISFFLEIMNTGLCDHESKQSQNFRDSLSMATHVVNLYRHLDGTFKGL